jgi:ubiquinone/menaquinone biosynthesis C-methylase UbiE
MRWCGGPRGRSGRVDRLRFSCGRMTDLKSEQSVSLLGGGTDPNRPDLENRVAFQWRDRQDTLSHLHATQRDSTVLRLLTQAVAMGTEPRAALDVGCAYGNYALMLNARLGLDDTITIHGVDLHEPHLEFGRKFSQEVPGYANCHFASADLAQGLPFEDCTFDAVCLADVLEHMERPVAVLAELRRVTKPGGAIVVSTPLKSSVFKRAAAFFNRLTRGRAYRQYYTGKDTGLDAHGQPVMVVAAGSPHISEMTLPQLLDAAAAAGLSVREVEPMSIMSGSRWFDQHPFVLSGLMFLEAVHRVLRRPTWAHSVVISLNRPV